MELYWKEYKRDWYLPHKEEENARVKAWNKARKEEQKAKAEYIKGLENEHKADEIEGNILDMCFGGLRPNQEDCPPLIVHNFKKLLEIANEESLVRATNYLGMFLSEQQQQDFMNKVSQLKEYKEYRLKKRINKLNEDF